MVAAVVIIASERGIGMGVFSVEVELRNWQNRFLAVEEQGEDVVCDAIVDTGSTDLCLPADVVEQLKLLELGEMNTQLADGSEHTYRIVGIVEVEVQGRVCQVRAIEMPRGSAVLLGAVPLEEMDWHVYPKEGRLGPNPRFPDADGPVIYALRMRPAG